MSHLAAGERLCDELAPELTSLLSSLQMPANFVPGAPACGAGGVHRLLLLLLLPPQLLPSPQLAGSAFTPPHRLTASPVPPAPAVTNTVLAEMHRRGVSRDRLVSCLREMGREMPLAAVRLLQVGGGIPGKVADLLG